VFDPDSYRDSALTILLQQVFTCICTRDRGRTDTILLSLVFETSASTNSATRAKAGRESSAGKGENKPFALAAPLIKSFIFFSLQPF
jgi:hypothetical protein